MHIHRTKQAMKQSCLSSFNSAKRFAKSVCAIRSKSLGWNNEIQFNLRLHAPHVAWRLRFGPVPALWPHRRISHNPANRASQLLRYSICETSILLVAVQIGPTVWLLVQSLKSCAGSFVKFPTHLLPRISVHEVLDTVAIRWMSRNPAAV